MGYPLVLQSENLHQVWIMTSTFNITVTCPGLSLAAPLRHTSLLHCHLGTQGPGGAKSSEAAVAPTLNAGAPDNLWRRGVSLC